MKNTNTTNKENATITPENMIENGCRIAITAINTVYKASPSPFIHALLTDAVKTSAVYLGNLDPVKAGYIAGNGADIVNDTILAVGKHEGESLEDKDENGATLFRLLLRGVHAKIRTLKNGGMPRHLYTQNPEGDDERMIPKNWCIEDWTDYTETAEIIASLQLTENQKAVLAQRLAGKGIKAIAKAQGTSATAVRHTLQKIGAKYNGERNATEKDKERACRELSGRQQAPTMRPVAPIVAKGDLLAWTKIDKIYSKMQASKKQ